MKIKQNNGIYNECRVISGELKVEIKWWIDNLVVEYET